MGEYRVKFGTSFFGKISLRKLHFRKKDEGGEGDRMKVSEEELFRQGKHKCKSYQDRMCLVCVRRCEKAGIAATEQKGQRDNEGPDHLRALSLTGV